MYFCKLCWLAITILPVLYQSCLSLETWHKKAVLKQAACDKLFTKILICRINLYFVNGLVKNPVYGSSDIPLNSATENQVMTSKDQDSQPTYQDLITDNGKI